MGKAAVDLPDPLQTPADAALPLTSTDDLLAQLAGEEIDRLLAEVDEQAGSPAAAHVPASAPSATPVTAPAPADPHAGVGPLLPIDLSGVPDSSPPSPAAPPKFDDDPPATVAAVAAAAEPDVTAELDAFFKTAAKVPHPVAEPLPPARLAAPPTGARVDVPESGPPELAETSAAERAGLNAPVLGNGPAAAAASAALTSAAAIKDPPRGRSVDAAVDAADDAPADDAPLPLYLKPLEWINAPMDACPSALRDFIGKAAIITLVNAAAVLVYVMLFRRR